LRSAPSSAERPEGFAGVAAAGIVSAGVFSKCHVLLSLHVSGTIDTDRWPVNDGKQADSACGIDV